MAKQRRRLSPWLSADDLREDIEFQKSFKGCKMQLETALLDLQRQWTTDERFDNAEVGRRVSVLNDVFEILRICEAPDTKRKTNRPKLHNRDL